MNWTIFSVPFELNRTSGWLWDWRTVDSSTKQLHALESFSHSCKILHNQNVIIAFTTNFHLFVISILLSYSCTQSKHKHVRLTYKSNSEAIVRSSYTDTQSAKRKHEQNFQFSFMSKQSPMYKKANTKPPPNFRRVHAWTVKLLSSTMD